MVAIDAIKVRRPFLATFVQAVSKCNQSIYKGAIDELCGCEPDKDVFDGDNSALYSEASTASDDTSERDDIKNRVLIIDTTSQGACLGRANGTFSPVNDASVFSEVTTPKNLRLASGAFSPTNDDSPREITKARRSRSMHRSKSASPRKWSSKFPGKERGSDTPRGSSPMKRSRTTPRSPSRQSPSSPRKSRTPKREGAIKKKSEAEPPTTKHRRAPPATTSTKATSVSSDTLSQCNSILSRGRAGGKSSNKNKSKGASRAGIWLERKHGILAAKFRVGRGRNDL
jgi:hypothetical protein